jgi:hypothetical protein
VHTVVGAEAGYDYMKLWHLDIWPKFGRAVGIVGADPAIKAEIDRLRDKDMKATFWGRLTCGVGDYGACQLMVTHLSANDGGPLYSPDEIEGWEGSIGRLPRQPGDQNSLLYFVLEGEVPILYGINGGDASIQAELEHLGDTEVAVRIWGELRIKAQQLTGTIIDVARIEVVETGPAP